MAMYDNRTFSDQCAPVALVLVGALIWATVKIIVLICKEFICVCKGIDDELHRPASDEC